MLSPIRRVTVIVLDSVGVGDAPDAADYGDAGYNTLANISRILGGLRLPNMGRLGLGNLTEVRNVPAAAVTEGAYGRLTEVSAGKDTTTGHWELAGVVLDRPFPTYPDGFPDELMNEFEERIGRKTLGNYPASGTEIIEKLGVQHIETGEPIIYTSADSVFQIAAHEKIVPVEQLYHYCRVAREMLDGEHAVGRVIARPFLGEPGSFKRTERRKDFSLAPPSNTILDVAKAAGLEVVGVGKIEDIFAHRGLTRSDHTGNNMAGVDSIIRFLGEDWRGLIFANLVDFDALYGHRNNPQGYGEALEQFDRRVPEILKVMREYDALVITADHGNDPTMPGTDHSRERVPVLITGKHVRKSLNLGTKDTFADVAATVAEILALDWEGAGVSMAEEIIC